MSITQPETGDGQVAESTREQLRILCSYYLTCDDFGRDLMLSTGRSQAKMHPAQLSRSLTLVPRSGLDAQAKLIDEVVQRFPLTLIR